jgi:antirestriction protein ArdC
MRAEEEVIAELGSALMSASHDFFHHVDDNNAAYIASWLKRTDAKELRSFLSQAQKAADYVSERTTISKRGTWLDSLKKVVNG